MPLEKFSPFNLFEISIPVERQRTKAKEFQAGATLKFLDMSIKPSEVTPNLGMKRTDSLTEKISSEEFQIQLSGSEKKPFWVFKNYGGDLVLKGIIQRQTLGILQVRKRPCKIIATFVVRSEDIHLTWGGMIWSKDIIRNKAAVIERFIVKEHIKTLIEDRPICKGEWNCA